MLCLLYPLRPESRTKFIAHTVLLPKEYSTLRAYTHQHSSRNYIPIEIITLAVRRLCEC